jgi:isopentenyl diphosphate isomerase/L-lactate dehydrogenase-like FMN-dependent dehydrogenase
MALRFDNAASIDDLRLVARRRMPRFVFDWLDGGAEDETGLHRNRAALDALRLQPRYLRDVSEIETGVTLLGQDQALPLGIAPVGFLNLAWPGTDLMLARMAARERIPMVLSTAASTPLEPVAEAAEGRAWFQLYVSGDETINALLLRRARAAGIEVLVITVDVASPAKRDRDMRHGMQIPFRMTPRILADLALHPAWALATLRAGAPNFANLKEAGFDVDRPLSVKEQQALLITRSLDMGALRRVRDAWPGPVLIKGILHPDDAVAVVEAGFDGVIVSNHGARQASYTPASIEVLAAIVGAVAGRAPVMWDSGLRRGADIARALALGAEFVFAGRAFAFGAAAGQAAGCDKALALLRDEFAGCLGQIGCPRPQDLDAGYLWAGSG